MIPVVTNSGKTYEDTYKIQFDTNNSTGSTISKNYEIGSTLGTLPTPNKTGYKLTGWYTNTAGGSQVSSSTIVTSNATYYAQWVANTDTKYTVKHWEQNITGNANSHDSQNYTLKDQENLTGTTAASVTPNVKSYTGFTSPSTQKVTIAADGSTNVNYYYTRNQYNVALTYDEGISSVTGAGNYYYEQSVTINASVKNNYNWVSWTGTSTISNVQKTFTMPAQNVELTAHTVKKEGTVKIKYIDMNSQQEISPAETKTGYVGNSYTTSSKTITDYQFIKVVGNESGTFTTSETEVTYYYAKKCKITVQYIDIYTKNSISENLVIDGYEGKEYSTKAKSIDNYTFLSSTNNTSGKMPRNGDTITFTYGKITKIQVFYIDETTNDTISEPKEIIGYVGKEYNIKPIYVEGYKYSQSTTNSSGIMTENTIQIYFKYLKQYGVSIRYVDINTNEEIEDSKNYEYTINTNYDVTKDYHNIDSYTFIKDSGNTTGTLTNENVDIVYYYAYNSKLIMNFYNIKTNEKISSHEIVSGYEEKEYKLFPKEITGYVLIKADNTSGKMSRTDTKVDFYYAKKLAIKLTIYNNKTQKQIQQIDIDAYEGKKYNLLDYFNDEDYKFVSSNIDLEGEFSSENTDIQMYFESVKSDNQANSDNTDSDNTTNSTPSNTTNNTNTTNTTNSIKIDTTKSNTTLPKTGKSVLTLSIVSIIITILIFIIKRMVY